MEGVLVERGGENVLAVGRELNERDGRIVVLDERLETLARGRVPNATQTIVAARDDERAVAVEVHGRDRVAVGRQRAQALARAHVPDAHVLVERARHDQIRLRVEVATEHVVRVALQRAHALALFL